MGIRDRIYTVLFTAGFLFLLLFSCAKGDDLPDQIPQKEVPALSNDDKEQDKEDNGKDNNPAPNSPADNQEQESPGDPVPPSDSDQDISNDPVPNDPDNSGKQNVPNDPVPDAPDDRGAENPSMDPTTPSDSSIEDFKPWSAEARAGKTWWMRGVNTEVDPVSSWRNVFGHVQGLEWRPGLGWYDLNKTDPHRGGTDSDLCWAAVCANVIQWWIDQNHSYMVRYARRVPSGFEDSYRSQIFELYKRHFTNKGGDLKASIEWFFNGMYAHKPLEGAGFFREVLGEGFKAVTQIGTSARTFSDDIAEALRSGEGLGCSLEYSNGYLHALSIWGADFDESGKLTHIYLTDSNDKDFDQENRNNKRETKAGLLRRAIKLDTATGYVYQEGSTIGSFHHRIIHLYKLPLYQDKWEAYFE